MKMLKHLFGKRDKELDVLQEEALQSPLRTVVRNFTSNRLAFGGLIVFLVIFLIVLIGPVFNPIDLSEKEETQINVAPGLNMMKVPDGLKGNVKEISTGATFSVGVDNDGKVYVWGYTKISNKIDIAKKMPKQKEMGKWYLYLQDLTMSWHSMKMGSFSSGVVTVWDSVRFRWK